MPGRYFNVYIFGYCIETWVNKSRQSVSHWIDYIYDKYSQHLDHLIVGVNVRLVHAGNQEENAIAVLSLCVGTSCLHFRIYHCRRIPNSLRDFLADPRFRFVGMDIESTRQRLQRGYNLNLVNAVDLLTTATERIVARSAPYYFIVHMQAVLRTLMVTDNREYHQCEHFTYEQIWHVTNLAFSCFMNGFYFLHL